MGSLQIGQILVSFFTKFAQSKQAAECLYTINLIHDKSQGNLMEKKNKPARQK